jgi:hypothetical protein
VTLQLISAAESNLTGSNFPTVALRMEIYRDDNGSGVSVAGNHEDLYVKLMLVKRGASGSGTGTFNNGGVCSYSVTVNGSGVASSGGVSYDFRSSSGRNATGFTQVLWEGWVLDIPHDADGNKTLSYGGSWGGDSNLGSQSTGSSVALPKITAVPNVPTGVAGARVSDTSITVSWAQSHPSNGAAVSNQIEARVNGGAATQIADISPTTSVSVSAAADQKLEYRVRATNAAGSSAYSAWSTAIYTTPDAPTSVTATKVGSDIQLSLVDNVAFTEHQHQVEHGVDVAGVVTWDGSILTTIASGSTTYTHVAPNPAQRHVYRIRSRNTDVGALTSAWVTSNVVQLLTAPAKPTVPAPPAFADKAAIFRFAWVHNPIDTTAQTKYQVRYSLNGGSSWAVTGAKTTSANAYIDFAANTWTANQAVTFQVRTKGGYDSGSDGDASYSPWSDSVTVTFKTKPVATITTPANASTYTQAALTVVLGFSQAEAATFVSATIGLYAAGGVTLLEEKVSNTLAGTLFTTRLADGTSYVIKATVTDSNGITSSQVTSSFSVDYTEPPPATVTELIYLPDSGIAQLSLSIPGAGGGYVAATSVSVDRVIDGVSESVYSLWPYAATLTFLDITPTIQGTNLYRITTRSADGATSVVEATLVVSENEYAYMSKGSEIIRFELDTVSSAPTVDSALFKAAGRRRPIGQYSATSGDLVVTGTGALADGYGSTPKEIEDFLLIPGRACYRDPTGRRMFGRIVGTLPLEDAENGGFSYTVTETE